MKSGAMRWQILALAALGCACALGSEPVEPGRIVMLEYRPGFQNGCGPHKMEFVRAMGDGSVNSSPFRVIQKATLVITDVDWRYVSGPPNQFVFLRLLVQSLANPDQSSAGMESTIRLDGFGNGGTSEHMTTGFVVRPEARICALVPGEAEGTVVRLSRVLLRGYVTYER